MMHVLYISFQENFSSGIIFLFYILTFGYQYNTVHYYVLLFISYKIFTYAIANSIKHT